MIRQMLRYYSKYSHMTLLKVKWRFKIKTMMVAQSKDLLCYNECTVIFLVISINLANNLLIHNFKKTHSSWLNNFIMCANCFINSVTIQYFILIFMCIYISACACKDTGTYTSKPTIGNILGHLLPLQNPKKERKKVELLLGKKNMNKNI